MAVVAPAVLAVQIALQRAYTRDLASEHRRTTRQTIALSRFSVALVIAAGLALVWRDDTAGAYGLAAGILMSFMTAGVNAWVLLIEINR